MKVKTSELTAPALDWAVAKCEGLLCFGYRSDGERFAVENNDGGIEGFMPSTSWQEGGPIIEREGLELCKVASDWRSAIEHEGGWLRYYGPTPLVAAMRCYVVSRLGDEIDVPVELAATARTTRKVSI